MGRHHSQLPAALLKRLQKQPSTIDALASDLEISKRTVHWCLCQLRSQGHGFGKDTQTGEYSVLA